MNAPDDERGRANYYVNVSAAAAGEERGGRLAPAAAAAAGEHRDEDGHPWKSAERDERHVNLAHVDHKPNIPRTKHFMMPVWHLV